MAANRTILILEGLPMANLKAYVPNFPKHPWESRKSLKLRELCPSKARWSRFVSLKKAVFSAFFERKCYLTAKPSINLIVLYIFRKLCIWGFRKSGWNSIFDILWSVRFLGTGVDWIRPSFLHCVLRTSEPIQYIWSPLFDCKVFWLFIVLNHFKLRNAPPKTMQVLFGHCPFWGGGSKPLPRIA